MKINIYVLYGGKSVEHDVSLKSASAILNALDRKKFNVYPVYITEEGVWSSYGLLEEIIEDPNQLRTSPKASVAKSIGQFLMEDFKDNEKNIVFPALHGINGEDGTVQGFLELLDIPYVGNEVLSSALAMDKVLMREIFAYHKIPQTAYSSLHLHNWQKDGDKYYRELEEKIGYPLYVKPANSGSSVGISRVANREELEKAFQEAFLYDSKLIIEKEVVGREMQTSVVGNEYPESSVSGEFIMERPFFDYNAKYLDGKIIPVVPARLEPELADRVRELAIKSFQALNCYGLARVDIFVTDDNEVLVNEVNTLPGFTVLSMTPVLWEASNGTTYAELVEQLIELGFERYEKKKKISYTRRVNG